MFCPWVGTILWWSIWQLQYSCLENLMDRGAWQATAHGVTQSQTRLKQLSFSHTQAHTQLSSVQSLSRIRLFATPWTTAHQTFLSITNSQSLLKLLSIELVMPSNHLILCHPVLLPPSIFPSITVFSNESVLRTRWPKYWEFQLQHQSFQ